MTCAKTATLVLRCVSDTIGLPNYSHCLILFTFENFLCHLPAQFVSAHQLDTSHFNFVPSARFPFFENELLYIIYKLSFCLKKNIFF